MTKGKFGTVITANHRIVTENALRGAADVIAEIDRLRAANNRLWRENADLRAKAEAPREVTEDDLPEELRKRLMPGGMEWPRFESGELVRFGDEYVDCDGKAAAAKAVKFYDICLFALFDKNQDVSVYGWRDRVNRPESHGLLGADGEPIKAGETVYGRFDGKEWMVIGFDWDKLDCPVRTIDEDGSVRNFYPKWFTHERPSNGDAKPPKTAGNPSPNGDGCPDSGMDGDFATETSRESDSVESDSWKRMCLDASASGSVYCLFYGISYKDVADARKKQIEDLERRAKKLSGVAE